MSSTAAPYANRMGTWNLFNNNTKVNIYQTKTIHIHGDALPWTIPISASHANGKSKSTYLLLLLEMAHIDPNTHKYIFKINKQEATSKSYDIYVTWSERKLHKK